MQLSVINFGAGPAALPASVVAEAAQAVLNYNNTGLSILEIPHRGTDLFPAILAESTSLVLSLTGLSADEYEVLWLQGGGRMQFAMIPMNFLPKGKRAGYIDSGHWAYDAQLYASQVGDVLCLGSTRDINYTSLPQVATIPEDLAYLHFTTNNTIYGTQWQQFPHTSVPLIADMSSDIFAQQRDYSQFDLFYAVAQKNIGAAGVTLVVVKKKFLQQSIHGLPPILDYKAHVQQQSVLNTPPVFNIYVSLLTLRWIAQKKLPILDQENRLKAALLYQEIDRNTLLKPIATKEDRSLMNVVFATVSLPLENELLHFCQQKGIEGIAGHRSVGGFRVSLYNAITVAQTERLVSVLQEFEHKTINK
jgi:phosphoserine aminotransferase